MTIFAAYAFALYVGHHIGDYWVQTDHQARHKGEAGVDGIVACGNHVGSYVLTQLACIVALWTATGGPTINPFTLVGALMVSAVFHYAADRREHGIMFRLAREIPGKGKFLTLGVPRAGVRFETWADCSGCKGTGIGGDAETNGRCWDCHGSGQEPAGRVGDNPSLGTGAWALDQSWHLATSVFLPALLIAAFS